MTLKIITGILLPQVRVGSARINFNPFSITGDATGTEVTESGSSGDFTSRPGKSLSIREFRVEDKDTSRGGSENDWFRITDTTWNTDYLEVFWSCEPGAIIREISFLITGDVQNEQTCVETIADLRALAPAAAKCVTVLGYYDEGDGGGGGFYWDAASGDTDNGGTVIAPTSAGTGRWKRLMDGALNVKWFGAKGNGKVDDTSAIQKTIDAALQNGIATVQVPDGVYDFNDTIHIGYGVEGRFDTGFDTIVLEGAGSRLAGDGGTLLRYQGLLDRPAINIQGGRRSGVRRLALTSSKNVTGQIQQILLGDSIDLRSDKKKYYHPSATTPDTPDTASSCGISIDAYSSPLGADDCLLRRESASDNNKQQEILQRFQSEFESKKLECAVLEIKLASTPDKRTIAGFNDEGVFISALIDDPSDELWVELNKAVPNERNILELATSRLGRTLCLPPEKAYPVVIYPDFVGGTQVRQYCKKPSSETEISECDISDFYIGIDIHPLNAGSGDFTKIVDSKVNFCAIGVRSSHQNGRQIDFLDYHLGLNHTCFSNLNPGHPEGNNGCNMTNTCWDFCYQIFDVGATLPMTCLNCYAEGISAIGRLGGGAGKAPYVSFLSCTFNLARKAISASNTLVPQNIFWGYALFTNCSFDGIYGLELFQDHHGPSPGKTQFVNCSFNNAFPIGCVLRDESESDDNKQQEILQRFQSDFESKKQECAVLVIKLVSTPKKWTIAGFNDEGVFKSALIDDPSDELWVELNKDVTKGRNFFELVTSRLGRTLETPKSIALARTGGVIMPTSLREVGSGLNVVEACKFSFNSGNIINHGVRDQFTYSSIYSTGANWSFGYEYVAPAWRSNVYLNLSAITNNGLTVNAQAGVAGNNDPMIGDILSIYNVRSYILLVQSYNSSTGVLTARICNDYSVDSNGTVTLLGRAIEEEVGQYYILRTGMFPRQPSPKFLEVLTIVTTENSKVVTLKDAEGLAISDATPYYQSGDSMMVTPTPLKAIERNPLEGFIVVTEVNGGNITINKPARKSAEIPATPGLCRGFF